MEEFLGDVILEKKNRFIFLYVFFFLVCVLPLFSQELPVIHYGVREGLPSVVITSVAQGPDGRIWVAHQAGISVYDGAEFHNWDTLDGLLASPADSLIVDQDDVVWMTFSSRGLQYFGKDREFHTVPDTNECYKHDLITRLFKMKDGSVLAAGHKGYYRVSRNAIEGPFFPVKNKRGRVYSIVDLGEKEGTWMAAGKNVFRLKKGIFKKLALPYDRLNGAAVADIVPGRHGEVWLLTRNAEVVKWQNGVTDFTSLKMQKTTKKLPIFKAVVDSFDNLWAATGNGLFRCKNGKVERFTESSGLSNQWINTLLVDEDGILWLGSEGGLEKISQMAFRNYSYRRDMPVNGVWAMCELSDKTIWAGTNAGIIAFDPDGNSHLIDKKQFADNAVIDLQTGEDGKIWILTYYGVHVWDGKRFTSFLYKPFDRLNLYGILPINRKEVWINTSGGVYSLNPQQRTFMRHRVSDLIPDPSSINHIVRGGNGEILICGTRIYTWEEGENLREITFPSSEKNCEVFHALVEKDRTIFATNEGLKIYDGKNWSQFPLKRRKIFDLVRAGDGTYWLGSCPGIGRFDGKDYRFFDYHDGVAVEECNSGAALLDSKGRVWLGGKNITIVDPKLIRSFPSKTPLITRVQIGHWTYFLPKKMEFSSKARSIGFYFAAPSFFNEKEQLFRYRFRDMDSNWSEVTSEHSIHYAVLPPGEHVFEIQSRQKNGDWSGPPAELHLTVKPTFWQSAAGKVFVGFFILVLGSLLGIGLNRQIRAQKTKFHKLVEEKTAKIKSQKDRLAELASTDEVTALPNRRRLIERLNSEIARAKRYGRNLSLCVFDIDDYKIINDTYGHSIGDDILKLVARVVLPEIRETDIFARWGGDEFVYLMPETSESNATFACRKLREMIQSASLSLPSGEEIHFTISGGVATYDVAKEKKKTSETLFEEADQALYKSKKSGKNKIIHFSELG